MAKQTKTRKQKAKNNDNSARPNTRPAPSTARVDVSDAPTLERLEAIAGGADEDDPRLLLDPELSGEADKLDAQTEEEVDALRVDLVQDGGASTTADSTGRVVDDTAEEQLARFTETGPMQADQGVVSVEPGRDNTSRILRRHHPNTDVARSQDVVEGNLDEPRDEQTTERKVDEGTAA